MTNGLHHDSSSNGAVPTPERDDEVRQEVQRVASSDTEDDAQRAVQHGPEHFDGSNGIAAFDKSRHFPGSQGDLARALVYEPVNAQHAVGADTLARAHRGTRFVRFRSNRLVGRAMAVGKRLERHVHAGRQPAAWGGPVDPMFAALPLYLLSFGLSGAMLEFGGSRASLQVWSDTLGGDIPTTVIAASLGLVLVMLGHLVGHMVLAVFEAKKIARRIGCLVLVAALVVPAVLAIDHIGRDRPTNLRAQSALAKAALLETAAEDGDREARNADRRAAGQRGAVKPSAAGNRLRAQAQADRTQARQMTTRALDNRSLEFFTAVQIAAFALAAGGGLLWAGGQMERMSVRYEKLKAKATNARMSLRTKLLGIAMLNRRSDALTRTAAISQTENLRSEFEAIFTWLFGPEPKWPDLDATAAEIRDGDEPDRRRRRRRHGDDDDRRRAEVAT